MRSSTDKVIVQMTTSNPGHESHKGHKGHEGHEVEDATQEQPVPKQLPPNIDLAKLRPPGARQSFRSDGCAHIL